MRREVYLRLGGRSSCSNIVMYYAINPLDCTHHDALNTHFFKRNPAKTRERTKSNCIALYFTLNHQVIYRYSPEKVRTLFENKFDSFHWFYCRKIE